MSFASRLKEARRNKKLTQSELGKIVGVANTTITGYEKGTSHPPEETIIALLDALDVDPNFLFQDDLPITKIPATTEDDGLTDIRNELIALFERLPDDKRASLLEFAKFQLREQNKE